ncbi:MAG: tetratricopeptide repeat protein, partial [Planctomycetota bacterium]
ALLALASPAPAAPAEEPGAGPEATFRWAFTDAISPEVRVRTLERVVIEHPDSPWADDALWVLGEAARRQGLHQRVVYYWQYLMGVRPDVALEEFTCSLGIHRTSQLAQVYVEGTGLSYRRQGGVTSQGGKVFVNVQPYSPAPMLVWEGLADCYEQLGKPELALKAYRAALESAPGGGQWAPLYRKGIERLERSLETLPARASSEGEAKAAVPSVGKSTGNETKELPNERAGREQEPDTKEPQGG